jgi:hypothetical protein
MTIEFYDVRKRAKVGVPESLIKKTSFERETKAGKKQIRYAITALVDGSKLTKFVSKDDWDKLNVPTV